MGLKTFFIRLAAKKAAKALDLKEGTAMETKKWWKSKGVLTGIVTVLVGAYETSRVALAPQLGWNLPEIPPFVYTVLGAIGIYSRLDAKTIITK